MWHSKHSDCTPVAFCTPSQKRNLSLLRLATVADSAAFCTETTEGHHDRFSLQCWMRPQSVVLNVAYISLGFLLLPPVLDWQLIPYVQLRYVYDTSHVYHTHFPCLQTVQNSPVDSDSLAHIASPQQHRTTRTEAFDNGYFLIRHILCHIVTQFTIANGNKQISQVWRTIYENFMHQTNDVILVQILKWQMIRNIPYMKKFYA
jgi:hypothetical protein